ncbi:uncharacterized protein G2W53_007591 [Senna tora]|uniref:Uncharacterized protein n=1 Tax=Senna tora TaxID=362788 RepID=A0A834X6Q9_9FABA|nr:uncharacterized protein G2W53_007591 [Senna tora]
MAWNVREVICKHILNQKSRLNLNRLQEVQVKRVVAQVIQTDRFTMSKNILNQKSRLNLKRIQEVYIKRVVAQVSQTDRFMLYFGIPVDLMLEWDL